MSDRAQRIRGQVLGEVRARSCATDEEPLRTFARRMTQVMQAMREDAIDVTDKQLAQQMINLAAAAVNMATVLEVDGRGALTSQIDTPRQGKVSA
jgi:hypothetical protein